MGEQSKARGAPLLLPLPRTADTATRTEICGAAARSAPVGSAVPLRPRGGRRKRRAAQREREQSTSWRAQVTTKRKERRKVRGADDVNDNASNLPSNLLSCSKIVVGRCNDQKGRGLTETSKTYFTIVLQKQRRIKTGDDKCGCHDKK